MKRAFTLIEVLIGILILAIALLGLGAVIPVVVRAQRNASDATAGIGALATAESYLRGNAELDRLSRPGPGPTSPPIPLGLGVWLLDATWSPATNNNDAYLWEPLRTSISPPELDDATGMVWLQKNPQSPTKIGLAERLYPARDAAGTQPQFVWDFIARRVATAAGQPMQVQAAVFLRRLDSGIRVPEKPSGQQYQWTLYDVVTGTVPQGPPTASLPAGARRVPVAVDGQGYPTGNGVGDYAGVRVMDVLFRDGNRRGRLEMQGIPVNDVRRTLATQPGQRIVDNLGNVYTVLGVADDDPSVLLVDPPVPMGVPDSASNAPVAREIRQVAFTPQVPVAVRVIDLTPQNSK